jgi:aspartyl-tRNA(Asn)/glutamyl-tRNA(Gln) amidotransferase subunit B
VERDAVGTAKVSATALAELVKLVDGGQINKGTGATVLTEMWETGVGAAAIVAEKGLAQVSDSGALAAVVAQVLDENAAMVTDYLGGKDKLFGALMGMCMKALKGKGNPQIVTDLLKQQIDARRSG